MFHNSYRMLKLDTPSKLKLWASKIASEKSVYSVALQQPPPPKYPHTHIKLRPLPVVVVMHAVRRL